jgi:hypothetical protein
MTTVVGGAEGTAMRRSGLQTLGLGLGKSGRKKDANFVDLELSLSCIYKRQKRNKINSLYSTRKHWIGHRPQVKLTNAYTVKFKNTRSQDYSLTKTHDQK